MVTNGGDTVHYRYVLATYHKNTRINFSINSSIFCHSIRNVIMYIGNSIIYPVVTHRKQQIELKTSWYTHKYIIPLLMKPYIQNCLKNNT